MSKPNRDSQLRLGEAQLQQWGVAPDASVDALRAVCGRDAAADLAIATRLGTHPEPGAVEALRALESTSADKLVRKEIKRSLYRLEQRGIDVPHSAAAPAVLAAPVAALEGYLSPVDGSGDQLVWLVKPHAGGLAHLFAVINDPNGLREVDLSDTTRKALRAAREQLLQRHELRMVEADWRYCDYLIHRAADWAAERGQSGGDYARLRAQLVKQPVTALPPLIFNHLDPATLRADSQLLAGSAALLEEKEFRTWFFDREALTTYLDEMLGAKSSPIVLHPTQQQERFRAVIDRAIEELFGGDMQVSWVRRLEEMAFFFHATARPQQARWAAAAALALESSSHGGRDIAFFEQLGRTSLAAFMQREEQREEEEARTSLVLTPQQAAREAQQRRR